MVYDSMLRSNHVTRCMHMKANLPHASRDVAGMTVGYQTGAGFLSGIRNGLGKFGRTIKNFVADNHGVIRQVIKNIPSILEKVGKVANFIGNVAGKSDNKALKALTNVANNVADTTVKVKPIAEKVISSKTVTQANDLINRYTTGKELSAKDVYDTMSQAAKDDYEKYRQKPTAPISAGPEKKAAGVRRTRKPRESGNVNKKLLEMLNGLKH